MQSIIDSVMGHINDVCKDNVRRPIKVKLRFGDNWVWCNVEDKEVLNDRQILINWDETKGDLENHLNLNGGNTLFDSGYGLQELYGFIWYNDGTWSERGEYDGSEWWEFKIAPDFNVEV